MTFKGGGKFYCWGKCHLGVRSKNGKNRVGRVIQGIRLGGMFLVRLGHSARHANETRVGKMKGGGGAS